MKSESKLTPETNAVLRCHHARQPRLITKTYLKGRLIYWNKRFPQEASPNGPSISFPDPVEKDPPLRHAPPPPHSPTAGLADVTKQHRLGDSCVTVPTAEVAPKAPPPPAPQVAETR